MLAVSIQEASALCESHKDQREEVSENHEGSPRDSWKSQNNSHTKKPPQAQLQDFLHHVPDFFSLSDLLTSNLTSVKNTGGDYFRA